MAVTTDTMKHARRMATPSMYPVLGFSYIPTMRDTTAATIRIWTHSSSVRVCMNRENHVARGEDGRELHPYKLRRWEALEDVIPV